MNQNKYSHSWGSVAHSGGAGQNGYGPVRPNSVVPSSSSPLFEGNPPRSIQSAYPSPYYTNSTNYPSNPPTTNPHSYSPISPTSPMNYAQTRPLGHFIPRPQSAMPNLVYPRSIARPQYKHSSSHSFSNSLSQSPTWPSHSMFPVQEQPRSVSPPNRAPSPSISYTASPYTENSDPPSPSVRPFACDLCSLSFNRQHDLKRHRETHTGEKPFLCNGGCGKTFTRKDALKRHQLVKSCGNIDEWA